MIQTTQFRQVIHFFVPKQTSSNTATNSQTLNSPLNTSLEIKNTNKLRILHQNIAGICNKSDLLDVTLHELENKLNKDIDILCFSETNIRQGSEENVKLNNYKLISSFCRDKSKGGTCILTKKTMDVKPLHFPPNLSAKFYFECCGIEVNTLNLIVITIYRIPNQTKAHVGIFLHKLHQLLEHVTNKYRRKKIILCGDWNIDLLKQNTSSKELKSIIDNYNFTIHIQSPTRLNSCIDLIVSNVKYAKPEILHLSLSDHETAQLLALNIKKHKSFTTWYEYRRDYNKDNLKKFTDCISAISFSDVLSSNNVKEAFKLFYEYILLFHKLCFPTIKVKINNRQSNLKWLSKGLKKSCRTKRKLYQYFCNTTRKNKTIKKELHKNYKKYNFILKKCIIAAQKLNNKRYIQNNGKNPKAIWRTISSTISKNLHINDINTIKFNNKTHTDAQEISDVFNKYFVDITNTKTPLKCKNNSHVSIPTNANTLYLNPVTENEIYNIIMSLKNTKCSGYDEITTKLLKLNAIYLAHPIAHIINLSFEKGYFPEQLKLSVIKPLFKKGDRLDPNNYRPITIIPILSKVYERAMFIRLTNFLDKFKILHPQQYGFRKGSSTSLACFDLINYITESLNNKTPIISIFLDMSKAFDFVNHERLLDKLEKYGIRGKTLDWLESYLRDRKQITEISQITRNQNRNSLKKLFYRSPPILNNTGVPQGSILAPLLFLIYINDLPNAIKHKSILFADDTTLIIKARKNESIEEIANSTLADVITWLECNNLQINLIKTKAMEYRSYNSNELNIQLAYNNNLIRKVNTFKFLGITIDQHLNWKEHIDQLCNKLDRYVYALKRLRQTISLEAALTAYHGYVASVLNYGLIMWGNSVDADRAFKLQKKCIRSICNAGFLDTCKPLFKKLNILPLPCLYIREVCCFVKLHPIYYKKYNEVSTRNVREKYTYLLHKPPSHAQIYKQNIYNMSIILYNKLPTFIKNLDGKSFKYALTTWLATKGFYSIKEYLEHDS